MKLSEGRGPVAGVVLAGGLSSRMGKDKALLRLPPLATVAAEESLEECSDGSLLARAHSLLLSFLPICLVSCRADAPRQGYECVFDAVQGVGPTAGLHAALCRAEERGYAAVLALSCDLPFMDASILRRLLAARNEAPATSLATAYRERLTGRVQALTAIYEVAALPYFSAALAQGQRRLASVVPREFQDFLDYEPEESGPFFNCNTPEDLASAQAILESKMHGF
ncbi:MAG: molybdenum cofactor guanylyltransferase [Desulfovibrio sp.]|uniref:molybdenum cofactor guanylyltransferase n=1 Tax=Desulfovibrio sp. TaxID=885 RepID=UPI0039E5B82B